MGVQVISGGVPVTLDDRLWSLNPQTMAPWTPNAYVGSGTLDPITVWKTQRSVRTVLGFLARNIAQVMLHGFALEDDGDRERIRDGRLAGLLKRPSPTTTPFEAMVGIVVDLGLWERHASWITEDDDGQPMLQRLAPNRWTFKRDGTTRPIAIVVQIVENEPAVELPLSEFLWLDGYPIPDAAPLCTLASLIEEERESSQYRVDLWRRGARMPGWIERPVDAPEWSPGGRDRFRSAFAEFARGGGRAGSSPVFEDGMQFHELSAITPEDAQQLETRKFSIVETASAFHVPSVFFVTDNANYSNVTAFREILYSDTLGPWFQQIHQAYNARVLPHPLVAAEPGEFVEFNVAEKLRMSFDEQAKILQTATGGPIMTRNEARQVLNLPQLDGADELIVPLNVLIGGQASPTDSAPED